MEIIRNIFGNIIYMAGMASLVAIIILILRKVFDKKISPKWKFAMWGLLLISLVIPFRFTLYSNNGSSYTVSSFVDKLEQVRSFLFITNIGKLLALIWVIGIICLSINYIINSIIMKIKIGKEEITEERIIKIFNQAKEKMQIKKEIKLIKQNYRKIPCIYGMFKPKILLNEEVLEKSDEIIEHTLMHELAHYKRKDLWLNKLMLIITTLYWFNPIIWFCFKEVRQDMELKADELVLNKIPKQNEKEYAKSLVAMLPISQEEKLATRLLNVTDSKKNMERRIKMIKLSKQFKEYKALIGVTTLVLTLCVGILIFTQVKPNNENVNNVQYFETPDRIVYKEKGNDNYYVFTSAKQEYIDILNQLIHCIDGIGEGEELGEEEIRKIEEEESYIELDYDTISKNYIIAYEKENYNVIKRTDTGGQVIKQTIKQASELKALIQKASKETTAYHMKEMDLYKFDEPITYEVPSWSNELKKYEQGIYTVRLGNMSALANFLENNNLNYDGNINEETFEKSYVIASITKYKVLGVDARVGGITYHFYGTENTEKYYITILTVSQATNINCIYRDYSNLTSNTY